MIYHFPLKFFYQNSYVSLFIKKTSIATAWEFVKNKFTLSQCLVIW